MSTEDVVQATAALTPILHPGERIRWAVWMRCNDLPCHTLLITHPRHATYVFTTLKDALALAQGRLTSIAIMRDARSQEKNP